ncbi:MAG: hypothetical protein HYU73_07150 [Betaproteobacteria bacterium]|nr:hypothetical protein [Betaproteobacteria bacterium]
MRFVPRLTQVGLLLQGAPLHIAQVVATATGGAGMALVFGYQIWRYKLRGPVNVASRCRPLS